MSDNDDGTYVKTVSDKELEESMPPETLAKVKQNGYAGYSNEQQFCFFMLGDRHLSDPTRPVLCYTAGICSNTKVNDSSILCHDCLKLFSRNGSIEVDFVKEGQCDDCDIPSRLVKIRRTNRQLCVLCFRISLDSVRRKKAAKNG